MLSLLMLSKSSIENVTKNIVQIKCCLEGEEL